MKVLILNVITKSNMIFLIRKILTFKLCLFILFLLTEFNYSQQIIFKHLTVEDGLSNNKVNTVIQDETGFIWFGTDDGLNRYDGYNFKVFRNDPSDSNSLSSNSIWALFKDHSGYIWIGTKDGILNQYDPNQEIFIKWKLKTNVKGGNGIANIFEDSKKNIWIATRRSGVYKLNPETKEILYWNKDTSNISSLSHHSVRTIAEDNSGNILIGTYFGLNKFNPEEPGKGFEKFFYESDNNNSLSDNQIYNLSKSSTYPNIFWIGTPKGLTQYNSKNNSFKKIKIPNPDKLQFGSGASTVIEEIVDNEKILWIDTYGGFIRMNINSGNWHRFVHDENNPHSIISNQINKIIKDKSGVIWIATENGVSFFPSKLSKFNSVFTKYYHNFLEVFKDKKNLRAITQSNDGNIWFGFDDGIKKLSYKKPSQPSYKYTKVKNLNIWSLSTDTNDNLWIGTFGQGLKQFDPTSGKIKNWLLKFPKRGTTTVLFIKSLLKDSKDNIWVGYWGSGVGRINPTTGNYNLWITETDNPKSITNSDIWTIAEDRFGRLWFGTQGGGLNLFEDKNDGIFHHWLQFEKDLSNLSSNNIYSICESKKFTGPNNSEVILWVGTSNGLNKFVVKNKNGNSNLYDIDVTNKSYTINDGLPDNSVNSILEDDDGNLWLGTGSGISFFNVSQKTFTNFSKEDGINGTVMNPEAALRLDDLLLFGSTKGLTIFDPKKIKLSNFQPEVVITDFQIFNKSVIAGKNSPLKKNISHNDKIILSHDQNVFSFEFASLDYNSPQSIQYAYMMVGFDKDWIKSGTRRFVTYTNLNPGKYVFKVKATNADGVWSNKIASLNISINPPWWKTLWAYGFYICLIVIGLLLIRRFEMNRAKLRNELKLRELEVKKKSELEELKSRFFANLSHEFRTPLMLIKGPLELLKKEKGNGNFSENIQIIERNSDQLKELIDQLLELSQLEKAAISLKTKQGDLVEILKGILSSFESILLQKNIALNFSSDLDSIIIWIDRDKFEKIINNLISNAIKFTPQEGKIKISINTELPSFSPLVKGELKESSIQIKIADSGVGIPKDKLDKIFNRFFQVDDSTQRSFGGSGIGLALVKEFIDLHKWKISVNSNAELGTEFTIEIPQRDDYLNETEKIESKSVHIPFNQNLISDNSWQNIHSKINIEKQNGFISSNNKPSILIVDDSEDVRKYLSSLLKDEYLIFEAQNGMDGINSAAEIIPDLIISDVMMPSMDGLEFCRRIKSDWQTSDIPVILLTAKVSSESKIEGLEIGADDYLTKPFVSKELFTRIKNLLEQRKRLRDKYSKNLEPLFEREKLTTADDDFINKALDLIEKNLDKTNFNTEQLSKELFVSRTQLHRKILAITGQAPGEFIRIFKLKHAAKLLIEKRFSVTQIAYEIGFSSPAQFTRAFTKQFNCLPSEFSTKNKS